MLCPGDSPHTRPWVDELCARGHEVLVYAYPPVAADFAGAHVDVVGGGGPLGRARWIARRVKDDKPDVVTQHYVATDAFALSHLGKPLVLSVWGSDVLCDLVRRPKRLMVAHALRSAALVVSPAQHATEVIIELGVDPLRVLTRQYGVDTTVYTSCRDGTAREAPVRVICTRGMRSVYGNEDIIDAVARTSVDHIRDVIFTGRGALLVELQALAAQLGLDARACFLGGVDDMHEALCSADIYCSMSRSDGASLSLLEAMSCGLPVVVSDIAANREWVVDGHNGFLVPCRDVGTLAERLETLAADPDLRSRVGRAGRETILERGNKNVNVPAIIDAVEKAVGSA